MEEEIKSITNDIKKPFDKSVSDRVVLVKAKFDSGELNNTEVELYYEMVRKIEVCW